MRNLNLLTDVELAEFGLSQSDVKAVAEERERLNGFDDQNVVFNLGLSESALKIIREAVADGLFDISRPPKDGFVLTFVPLPKLSDQPSAKIKIEFTDDGGAARSIDRELPLEAGAIIRKAGVDLSKQITCTVTGADGTELRKKTFTAAQIERRRVGAVFFGKVEVRSLPLVLEDHNRFVRSGRFIVATNPNQRFDSFRLVLAPIPKASVANFQKVLGQSGTLGTASKEIDVNDQATGEALSALSLGEAGFEFDGSFSVDKPLSGVSGDYSGWAWFLAGPKVFFGILADNHLAMPEHGITILLPVFKLDGPDLDNVPLSVGEEAMLDRPELFGGDPGLVCKPFDNPGRILGERRFSTVLRVSDPDLGDKQEILRETVSRFNEIEWENDPRRYQARSIAFGHILEHRVRYRSNGYSLGNVAHSMTLAPRQTRRIVKIDFERQERARRSEQTVASDEVDQATLSERTYSDAVQSNLSEWSKGGSKSKVTSGAAGIGAAIGPVVIGGGAAHSSASSSSWQSGGRSVAAAEQQNLRDAIRQYGDSIRSIESTVVTEVDQSETVEGVSEVVRNVNYCHALSVVYYEILRHIRVDTEIGGVRECLFVPLEVRSFTDTRIARHKDVLSRVMRRHSQRLALRYLEEIQSNFTRGDSIPAGERFKQTLSSLNGSLYIRMGITRPTEGDIADEVDEGTTQELSQTKRFKELVKKLAPFSAFAGRSPTKMAHEILSISENDRDSFFQREIAPHMARAFVDRMRIGRNVGTSFQPIAADLTLAGNYRYDGVVKVDFNVSLDGTLSREDIRELVVMAPESGEFEMPEKSFADMVRANISFSTPYYRRNVRSDGRRRDDLLDPLTGAPTTEGATASFPFSSYEEQNTQERLREAYKDLKAELNSNLYRYHKAIWWRMDRDELFTMLDGFTVADSDPRSVASVVERRPIGILGNSMVFRVAPGGLVDPNFATQEALIAYYKDNAPKSDPIRISLPTSGLYARAHMDECNACEEHGGTRDWVLEDPDPALADLPATLLQSRRAEPQNLQPTDFPETIINLQNAPAAPAPTGLQGALNAATTSNAFRDMAGLAGTQNLASKGLETAAGLATNFGQAALNLRLAEMEADKSIGKKLSAAAEAANGAVAKGHMTKDQANTFVNDFAKKLVGTPPAQPKKPPAEQATKLAETLGPNGAATLVDYGADGTSVASFDNRALLAQNTAGGLSSDPSDPVNQLLARQALHRQAQEWAQSQSNDAIAQTTLAQVAGRDEYLEWASNQNTPDTNRLRDDDAQPGSGHSEQARLLGKLTDYIAAARPNRNAQFHRNTARNYTDDTAAWSASFVSFLMSESGADRSKGFHLWNGHSRYTIEALVNRLNRDYSRPFWLFRPSEVSVAVGDIIVKARTNQTIEFDRQFFELSGTAPNTLPRIRFENGKWEWGRGEFTSHADMVLDIVTEGGTQYAYTIGGNTEHLDGTADTVGKKKYRLSAAGEVVEEVYDALHPRVVAGTNNAGDVHRHNSVWAVIKRLDSTWFDDWRRHFDAYIDATDSAPFMEDSFLEVFGTPNAAGDLEMDAATMTFLQASNRGASIFPESTEPDFSDMDRNILFAPIFHVLPGNVA